MSVTQLRAMRNEIEEACRRYHHLSPGGRPNYRLLYSSAETFIEPTRFMILGTNPGGEADVADRDLNLNDGFDRASYSAYLDDDWGQGAGQHRLQRAVRGLIKELGEPEDLLRRFPTGNLIPFRSKSFSCLPSYLVDPGLKFGFELIEMTRPTNLILMSSRALLWNRLKGHFGLIEQAPIAHDDRQRRTVRLATSRNGRGPLKRVIALPAFNSGNAGTTKAREWLRAGLST